MTDAEQFFYEHGSYSYDPLTETPEQGRERCAAELATAEAWAKAVSAEYRWYESDIDSSDFSDEAPVWRLWDCSMHVDGECAASLGAIDFGRDGEPGHGYGILEPYARVVQAELAAEAAAKTNNYRSA